MPRWFTRKASAPDEDPEWTAKKAEIEQAQDARRALLIGQEDFVSKLEALLFQLDPIGINFDENTDEYRAEAETITIRLPEAHDEGDALRIVHEEFVRWFGGSVAGPPERYAEIAREVWDSQQNR